MNIKSIFANKSGIFQIWILLILFFLGWVAGSLAITTLTTAIPSIKNNFFVIQSISSFFIFFVPLLLASWLCSKEIKEYLYLNNFPPFIKILLALFALQLLAPVITLTAGLNSMVSLPSFMAPLEESLAEIERANKIIVQQMIAPNTLNNWIASLLVIAAVPALCEELFFRGVLTRMMGGLSSHPHRTIWLVAIIFSAIHLEYHAFIPRVIMGAFLGYLVLWTGSITTAIIAHFCNNAITIIAMKTQQKAFEILNHETFEASDILPYTLLSMVTMALFFYVIKWIQKPKSTIEDSLFKNN